MKRIYVIVCILSLLFIPLAKALAQEEPSAPDTNKAMMEKAMQEEQKRAAELTERYEKLLAKSEQQSERYERILNKWEEEQRAMDKIISYWQSEIPQEETVKPLPGEPMASED